MRNVARILLIIPMSVGMTLGLFLSPFVIGFITGLSHGETLITKLDDHL